MFPLVSRVLAAAVIACPVLFNRRDWRVGVWSWEAYLWIVTGTSLSGVEFTVGCISITVASYVKIFKYSYIPTIVAWVL